LAGLRLGEGRLRALSNCHVFVELSEVDSGEVEREGNGAVVAPPEVVVDLAVSNGR